MDTKIEELFGELFLGADDAVIVLEMSKMIKFVNKQALNIIDLPENYLILDTPSEEIWCDFIDILKINNFANCILNILDLNGEFQPIQLFAYYISEKQLIFARLFPMKKRIEKKQMDYYPKELERMTNKMNQAVIVTSKQGKILSVNTKVAELLGKRTDYLVDKSHDVIFEDFENESNAIMQYYKRLNASELATIDAIKTTDNGEMSYLRFESVTDTKSNLLITTIFDETEKMSLLEKIEYQNSINFIGQHIATLVHEIRNPMTSLYGFIQLLKGEAVGETQRMFTIMESELKQMDFLVSNLLNFSKPQKLIFEYFCFKEMVKEVIDLLQAQAMMSNTLLTFQCNEQQSFSIRGNKVRLKQMALNLIKNAIEAVDIDGRIIVKLTLVDNNIEFSISDEGVGMEQQVLDNLFTPFYTTKSTGTGLGLLLVKKVVEEHNGDIVVVTNEGKGTQFKITLSRFDSYPQKYYQNLELRGNS